jgi:5-methylcytosine-specific restriction endonuclease McrA
MEHQAQVQYEQHRVLTLATATATPRMTVLRHLERAALDLDVAISADDKQAVDQRRAVYRRVMAAYEAVVRGAPLLPLERALVIERDVAFLGLGYDHYGASKPVDIVRLLSVSPLKSCVIDRGDEHPVYLVRKRSFTKSRNASRAHFAQVASVRLPLQTVANYDTLPVELHAPATWVELCRLYDDRCAYCGADCGPTMDHLIPKSLGGSNALWNAAPACVPCNTTKGSLAPMVWLAQAVAPHPRVRHAIQRSTRMHLDALRASGVFADALKESP